MIGSPDLLAFTGTEGFGGGEDDQQEAQGIPEEFSVPLLPSCHPWTTSAQFHRDFILVAEFSEQVGPKPVLTIPDDSRVIGSFDLNHFSVRIMSVDYQASGPGPTHSLSPGPRLNFSEDSKVILGDSAEDSFAYVHHMTLYDLEARGMVRPFCMAYVCSDQAKLMENFAELSTCFSQASDSLKTGNRQAFSMELQRKLQQLEYRQLTLRQEIKLQRTEDELTEVEELEAVERSITSHRELLRQVTSYPNRKLKQPDFLPYDPADSLTDPTLLLPPEPCFFPSTSKSSKSEHHLKPLQELCNDYFLSLMKEQLADAERRLRGDRSVLRTMRVAHSLSRRLTLTNFLFELWSPGDAEEEEEEQESAEVELPWAAGRQMGVEVLRSHPPSLESFFSCVEEIPIKLEAEEAVAVTPDPGAATPDPGAVTSDPGAAAEMTGSVSSGDSIEVLGTEKSYRTQHFVTGSDCGETPVGTTDACSRRAAGDAGTRRVRVYAKRANSEDSIEVLSTTESIFADDLSAITEEEAEQQSQSNGFENEEEPQTERRSDDVVEEEEETLNAAASVEEEDNEGDAFAEESLKVGVGVALKEEADSTKRNEVHEDETPETSKVRHEEVESTPQRPGVHRPARSAPDLHVNFAPPAAPAEVELWSPPPRAPQRLLSVDEASDCNSFTGSSDPPAPNILSNGRWDKKRRRKAGLRALRFIKQNSFSQHAVFCLLSGRPLVVIGGEESLVRKLVDALSLFLPAPGPDGSAVMPCLTTPLQLTDLLTWRLIGIHRSPSTSSSTILHSLTRYSRYLSLLDLDQRTLKCPPYSGSLLSRLADPHIGISRGITYLLHLESCLTALANQALLHTFKPAPERPRAEEVSDSTEEGEVLCSRELCSSKSDFRAMHFLSDLIKQRHAGRGPPVLRFSYSSVRLYRNTFAP